MKKTNKKIDPEKVPFLRGEPLYIPFVGAIVSRTVNGTKEILVQTRSKSTDSKYSDVIEIPGGKFRAYEDIYETLKREVKEEAGIDITLIKDQEKREVHENRGDTSEIIQPFCTTQMKEGPFIGLIFLCEGSGELLKKSDETKEIKWMAESELELIVNNEPERIYTAFLAPLKKYFREPKVI